MVSLFSQLSVMTHSARSAPNIAYRCYLLNFEKPLGKLRSWARFQAFLCRLGAHQVVWLNPPPLIIFIALGEDPLCLPSAVSAQQLAESHRRRRLFEPQPPVFFYAIEMKITAALPHQTRSAFHGSSL